MEENGNWSAIRALTEQMVASAHDADWNSVADASARRNALLKHFFADPLEEGSIEAVRQKIEEVMALDRETMGLVDDQRQALADRLREVKSRRNASQAYSQVAK